MQERIEKLEKQLDDMDKEKGIIRNEEGQIVWYEDDIDYEYEEDF
jgi:hypothetical protein